MKKILPIITIMLFVIVSCAKEFDDWGCSCKKPYPITRDENVPDISWTEYNCVRDACLHFERIVNTEDVVFGNLPSYILSHVGDTLKVQGWLWNSENSLADIPSTWIANNEKYASGLECYPPWTGTGGDYGEGIELINLHVTDSTYIRNKCFLTGIIAFTSFDDETGELACQHFRLKLNVIDIYFEENRK